MGGIRENSLVIVSFGKRREGFLSDEDIKEMPYNEMVVLKGQQLFRLPN